LREVLKEATASGVSDIVTVGTHPADWPIHLQLVTDAQNTNSAPGGISSENDVKLPKLYCTLGLHPCEVDAHWEKAIEELSILARKSPIKAIGETGLDATQLPNDPIEAEKTLIWRKEAFRQQLILAKELNLPIIVHCRNLFKDCMQIIESTGFNWQRVVFHCFTGSPEEAKQLQERNAKVSFSGIVTFKNAHSVREALKVLNPNNILIETDAPLLSPEPLRGQENQPSFLRHTATFCAKFLNTADATFCSQVTRNSLNFFRILG
jgi:TatD DNase family protein